MVYRYIIYTCPSARVYHAIPISARCKVFQLGKRNHQEQLYNVHDKFSEIPSHMAYSSNRLTDMRCFSAGITSGSDRRYVSDRDDH